MASRSSDALPLAREHRATVDAVLASERERIAHLLNTFGIDPADRLPTRLLRLKWDALDPAKIQRVFLCNGESSSRLHLQSHQAQLQQNPGEHQGDVLATSEAEPSVASEADMAVHYGELCGDRMKVLFDFKSELYRYFGAVDAWEEYATQVREMMRDTCPNTYNEIVNIAKGSAEMHGMTETMLFMMACEYEASMTFCDRRRFRDSHAASEATGSGGSKSVELDVMEEESGSRSYAGSVDQGSKVASRQISRARTPRQISSTGRGTSRSGISRTRSIASTDDVATPAQQRTNSALSQEPRTEPRTPRRREQHGPAAVPAGANATWDQHLLINRAVRQIRMEKENDFEHLPPSAMLEHEEEENDHNIKNFEEGDARAVPRPPQVGKIADAVGNNLGNTNMPSYDGDHVDDDGSVASESLTYSLASSDEEATTEGASTRQNKQISDAYFRRLMSSPKACTGLVCRAYVEADFSLDPVPVFTGVKTFELEHMEESFSAPETILQYYSERTVPGVHTIFPDGADDDVLSEDCAAADAENEKAAGEASEGNRNVPIMSNANADQGNKGAEADQGMGDPRASCAPSPIIDSDLRFGSFPEPEKTQRAGHAASAPAQPEGTSASAQTPAPEPDPADSAKSAAVQPDFSTSEWPSSPIDEEYHSRIAGTLSIPHQKRVRFVNLPQTSSLLYYNYNTYNAESNESYEGVTTSIDPPNVLYKCENAAKEKEGTRSCTGACIQTNDETPALWLNGALDCVVVYPGVSARYLHPGLPMYMGVNAYGVTILWMAVDDGSRNVLPGPIPAVGASSSFGGDEVVENGSHAESGSVDFEFSPKGRTSRAASKVTTAATPGGGAAAQQDETESVSVSDHPHHLPQAPLKMPGAAPDQSDPDSMTATTASSTIHQDTSILRMGIPTTVAMREMLSKKSAEEAVLWLQEQSLAVPNSWFVADKKTRFVVEVAPNLQVFVRDCSEDDFCSHANQFSECQELIDRDLMRVKSSPQRLQRCRLAGKKVQRVINGGVEEVRKAAKEAFGDAVLMRPDGNCLATVLLDPHQPAIEVRFKEHEGPGILDRDNKWHRAEVM